MIFHHYAVNDYRIYDDAHFFLFLLFYICIFFLFYQCGHRQTYFFNCLLL